jgi:hypothetical protein
VGVRGTLFALAFVVVGISITGFGVMDYQNQQSDLQEAVEVEGTVQSTDVHEHSNENGYSYDPYVKYTYSYEGQQYTSRSVYPGLNDRTYNDREKAEEVVSQFSPGETTTVYVNRENPSSAFLIEDTQPFRPFLVLGGGVLFAAIGFLLLFD